MSRHVPVVLLLLLIGAGCSNEPAVQVAAPSPLPSDLDVDPKARSLIDRLYDTASKSPESAAARTELAMGYHANGVNGLARSTYKQALELDPNVASTWYQLARVEKALGDPNAALAAVERALGIDPSYATAHARRGFWLLEMARDDEAEAAFREAIERDPLGVNARAGLARVAINKGAADKVVDGLRKLSASAPNDGYIRFLYGTALRATGDAERAAIELEAGSGAKVSWTGRDPWARDTQRFWAGYRAEVARARAFLDAGRPAEAIGTLRSLAEERPDDIAVLNLLHRAQAGTGRIDEAIATLSRCADLDAENYAVQTNLGRLYMMKGRFEAALRHTARALEINDTAAAPHSQRGRILLQMGRYDEAIAALDEAIELESSSPEHRVLRAGALLQAERFAEAEEEARRVTESHPRLAGAWQVLGRIQIARNDLDGARQSLLQALNLAPQNRTIQSDLRSIGG